MSDELKWCKHMMRAFYLRGHKKYRVSKKNAKRVQRLLNYALKRWDGMPYPPEWRKNDRKV